MNNNRDVFSELSKVQISPALDLTVCRLYVNNRGDCFRALHGIEIRNRRQIIVSTPPSRDCIQYVTTHDARSLFVNGQI